jgi:hypothetical protein
MRKQRHERTARLLFSSLIAGLAVVLAKPAPPALAADPPDYLRPIAGMTHTTQAETATQNVLALNTAMFELYGEASRVFQRNILAQHPLILGLFTGAGGRFLLYRPGAAPIEAPSVPVTYQLLKSVGHSTMALAEVVTPYLDNPADQSWLAALLAYRSRMQSAAQELDSVELPPEWRAASKTILRNNIAFMDAAAAKHVVSLAELQDFAKLQAPSLKIVIAAAAQTQVAHWMEVIAGWKQMLGADWNKTYAASNSIYVTRQNNVLFSVLAQFFPPDAINSRLLLIETISFTSTPADMLESLTRIIADRTVGSLFFGNYGVMDYELMGGDARRAILAEDQQRGITPSLPPAVPFGSHQWPTLITPGPGAASLADLP